MSKYRKKPVVIEAQQFTADDCWASWLEHKPFMGMFSVSGSYHPSRSEIYEAWITIDTLEGAMRAQIGDWVIKGVKDEFYPCKPDIFEMTYERVDEGAQ